MEKQSSFILSIGFIISAVVLGVFFISTRNEQSIRVVGQGVKSVTSDVAKWNITINKCHQLVQWIRIVYLLDNLYRIRFDFRNNWFIIVEKGKSY